MKTHRDIEQGSDAWHQIRKGKITGTMLKQIMGTPKARSEATYEFIAELLTVGIPDDENPMERGKRLEPEALAAFTYQTGLAVETVGFCEHDDDPSIANSPDALVVGKNAAVEVKCLNGAKHVKMWFTESVPDDYKWQVVQYFVVNDQLETLYFVGYHPEIESHPLVILTISRSSVFAEIEEARAAQVRFLDEVNEKITEKNIIEF